jgi:hypothetical protein
MKTINLLITIGMFFFVMAPAFASEGGGGGPQTKYFDVAIHSHKKVYSPGDEMELEITVTDKNTKEPVTGATIAADLMVYQGGSEKEVEEAATDGDGVYMVKRQVIKKIVRGIDAEEAGEGVYILKKKLDTEASIGGSTVTINIEKDGKSETVTWVISFMEYNVYLYAILVTLGAMAAGAAVGIAFGGVSH